MSRRLRPISKKRKSTTTDSNKIDATTTDSNKIDSNKIDSSKPGSSDPPPKKKKRKYYSQTQMDAAVNAVKDGSTICKAATVFGIPRTTIFNKVSGKSPLGKTSGPKTILSFEEERIVEKWVLSLATRGFPVTKNQLVYSVQLYLNINKRETPFLGNLPGRKWYNGFLNRHPILSEKVSQNLTVSRAAVTEQKIRNWHAEVLNYCEINDLLDVLKDPSRLFNMDEKGFILTPNKEMVIVRRGEKAVYNRSKNDEKENVTALLGGSGAGLPTPPMLIHSFKRMPSSILLNNPEKWSVGISDSGWQTQVTFFDYMTNIFYKFLLEEKIKLPVILFIDGHKSHVSLALSEFCAANGIELIALYPNSTHLTQPMDVGKAKEWRVDKGFAKIERKDVAPILKNAIAAITYSELLKKAFHSSGLYPFTVENINFSRILPSVGVPNDVQEQLWSETTDTQKDESTNGLQHLESNIDETVLDLFRSSSDVWTGDLSYAALFKVWRKMYIDASQIIATAHLDGIYCMELDDSFTFEPNETITIVDDQIRTSIDQFETTTVTIDDDQSEIIDYIDTTSMYDTEGDERSSTEKSAPSSTEQRPGDECSFTTDSWDQQQKKNMH